MMFDDWMGGAAQATEEVFERSPGRLSLHIWHRDEVGMQLC